jgi:hypothetical protein
MQGKGENDFAFFGSAGLSALFFQAGSCLSGSRSGGGRTPPRPANPEILGSGSSSSESSLAFGAGAAAEGEFKTWLSGLNFPAIPACIGTGAATAAIVFSRPSSSGSAGLEHPRRGRCGYRMIEVGDRANWLPLGEPLVPNERFARDLARLHFGADFFLGKRACLFAINSK